MAFSTDAQTLRRIFRRKQFVLGPRPAVAPEGWRTLRVAGGQWLAAHPDLGVSTAVRGSVELTMLGYAVDPGRPEASDAEIVRGLAGRVAAGADLLTALDELGGRFLMLLARPGHGPTLVGDAGGTLTVFHATVDGQTWCAAQSDLLARLHGFEPDPEAVDFIALRRSLVVEYAWPVDTTPYTEVRRLLPNHCLDLATGEPRRYWPSEPLAERSVKEVAPRAAQRLQALIAAAARRFYLTIGVSAGLDSRLMMAATAGLLDRVEFYSGLSKQRDANHPDLAIPRRILADAKAEHHVIVTDGYVSDEFLQVYRDSLPIAHSHRAPGLERQLEHYRLTHVAAVGNVSENARAPYLSRTSPPLPAGGMTPEYCGRLTQMEHPFARRAYERWLAGVPAVRGYDPRELLFWECRNGSWFASNVSQFVLAWQDVFLPYNCRALLTDLMSAPLSSRVVPVTELYGAVVAELWPELMRYEINPENLGERVRKEAYRRLRNLKRRLVPAV